jgi:hypothetical protein
MYQQDLWEQAAECTRVINATDDPEQRQMLIDLRDMWIKLANESVLLTEMDTEMDVAIQVAEMTRLHATLTRTPPSVD